MKSNINEQEYRLAIERYTKLNKGSPDSGLQISYDLETIGGKITGFFLSMRNQTFRISMDVDEDEIESILNFIRKKKQELGYCGQ